MLETECTYCSLDMLIVPFSELCNTGDLLGKPLQVAVNVHTSEVVNNTKSMLDLKLIEEEDIVAEALEKPVVYGKYIDYKPTTSFVALSSSVPFTQTDVFTGSMNSSEAVHRAPSFDNFLDAQMHLHKHPEPHQLIVELVAGKLHETIIKEGISNFAIKTFSINLDNMHGTMNKKIVEDNIEEETRLMLMSRSEADIIEGEKLESFGSILASNRDQLKASYNLPKP